MSRIFDRISKGKATTRDVYLLRYIASNVKERVGQEHNFVLDIIEDFYEEIEHHIEYGECPTGTCPQLAQLRITDKCVGCGACKRASRFGCRFLHRRGLLSRNTSRKCKPERGYKIS